MWRENGQQCLRDLIRLVTTAPWLIVLLAATLAGIALWYTASALEFETSRNALVASEARHIRMKEVVNEEFEKFDCAWVQVLRRR